jgi:hypothetical protein
MTTDHGRKPPGLAAIVDRDWRDVDGKNFITPVQDQGPNCRSSAAFAVTSAMNAWLRVKYWIPLGDPDDILIADLSPADIFFCGGGQCATGMKAESALNYATRQGVVLASDFPYAGHDQPCRTVGRPWHVNQLSGITALTTIQEMELAILSGPLVATFQVYQDFLNYAGGVYRWDNVSPPLYPQTVCVVGCDPAKKTWICKNSWGPKWGPYEGFFYIRYGECGIDGRMWQIDGFSQSFPVASAAGKPTTRIYNGQLHLFYRAHANNLFDIIKVGPGSWAPPRRIGVGVAAAGNLSSVVYDRYSQLHLCYRDADTQADIWDDLYDPTPPHAGWSAQKLGAGTPAKAPAAAGDPNAVAFTVAASDQLHFCYRDTNDNIQDIYYSDGKWLVAQLTGGGRTKAPAAAGEPKTVVFNGQLHVCYRDKSGNIQDVYYADGWIWQQLAGEQLPDGPKPRTAGPLADSDTALVIYASQMHVCYRDRVGVVVDAYYDPTGGWSYQLLGPASDVQADGDPAVTVYGNQMHVCYRDTHGNIWDALYDPVASAWRTQQLAGPGSMANAPPADSDPTVVAYSYQGGEEMHLIYRDKQSNLRDASFDGRSRWRQVPLGY